MSRLMFALCVLPALFGALLELHASGAPWQVAVDLAGVAAGTWACSMLALPGDAPFTRSPRIVAALAVVPVVIVVVAVWPTGYSPWAAASAWIAMVAAGCAASRIVTVTDVVVTSIPAVAASMSALRLSDGVTVTFALAVPTITAIGIGLLVRAHRQRLAAERGAAVATERMLMARELHDVVAHEVMGIVVLAQAAQPSAGELRPVLARIEEAGRRGLADIRAMVGALGDAGPAAIATRDLDDLVARFAETVPAEVSADIDPTVRDPEVADTVALAAYRILAEALNNIRRHAGDATRVHVEVRRVGDLVILVRDNGSGGGLGGGSGSGLTGLAARAESVGGTVTAGRGESGGWQVRARLPISGRAGDR